MVISVKSLSDILLYLDSLKIIITEASFHSKEIR